MFPVRLITAESYVASPVPSMDVTFSDFRGCDIKRVPVIRVFGTTPNGDKVCLHVHGVFPYVSIPCTKVENMKNGFAYRLAVSLDSAINVSLGSAKSNLQHVFKVECVSGIPYYGYHVKEHMFFKIYFYDPAMVKRATELLQNGSIMQEVHQPHDAHIPYILQFMIDYNLQGMAMINLKCVKHRMPEEALSNSSNGIDYLPRNVEKLSTCRMEVDALASDIANKHDDSNQLELNPGLEAIWDEERARRRQVGLNTADSQLMNPTSPSRSQTEPTDNDIYQQERFMRRVHFVSTQLEEEVVSDQSSRRSYAVEVIDDQQEILQGDLSSAESLMKSVLTAPFSGEDDESVLEALQELANEHQDASEDVPDNDSILGSQHSAININDAGEQQQPEEVLQQVEQKFFDSDEDEDFNLTCMELENTLQLNISQLDGADDDKLAKLHSPSRKLKKDRGLNKTPSKRPSTSRGHNSPKTRTYKPLDIIITSPKVDSAKATASRKRLLDEDSTKSSLPKSKRLFDSKPTAVEETDVSVIQGTFESESDGVLRKTKSLFGYKESNKAAMQSKSKSDLVILKPPHIATSDDNEITEDDELKSESPIPSSQPVNECEETAEQLSPSYDEIPSSLAPAKPSNELLRKIFGGSARLKDKGKIDNEESESVASSSPESARVVGVISETESEEEGTSASINYTFTRYIDEKLSGTSTESEQILSQSRLVTVTPKFRPPSLQHVKETMESYGLSKCKHQDAFYGNAEDATKGRVVAEKRLRVATKSFMDEPTFTSQLDLVGLTGWRKMKANESSIGRMKVKSHLLRRTLANHRRIVTITPIALPPSSAKVRESLRSIQASTVSSPTQTNKPRESSVCSKYSNDDITCVSKTRMSGMDVNRENLQNVRAITTPQYLTLMSLEVHVCTREDLLPDPQKDPLTAVFYAIQTDSDDLQLKIGAIIVDPEENRKQREMNLTLSLPSQESKKCNIDYVEDEIVLLHRLIKLLNDEEPEILVGWELEYLSWGYVFNRSLLLNVNIISLASRIKVSQRKLEHKPKFESMSDLKLPGRLIVEVWRIMRHEIALQSYSFENIMYHVLHERVPKPPFSALTRWWKESPRTRNKVLNHYTIRAHATLRILNQLDVINRTSEYARIYGIQFYEVFSRGSQFRVESMMLRLAKPLNYIPVSPSPNQRACMRAPEALPLILEPESMFYCDPMVVLDFQSLYPSIIIAYNYCFSTCTGRVELMGQSEPFTFGATTLKLTKRDCMSLAGKLNFAPCGVGFVKESVRKGVLPRMLDEILQTRLMVKKAIKDHSKSDKTLQRALDARQLGLKLIANVTYGYTAANFSGRMPCIEVGDSVVSKGKETLERAIKLIESRSEWRARVVYGDTDSIFILLPGRSKSEAFRIGAEMADAVTASNPKPVKLKFEKVLYPSILQTKKRYCGYMYEDVNQKEPQYLAKGIETVRRDSCPAASKILEKSLKILFDTKDISLVKKYVTRQLDKVLTERVSIQDLTFAREFRGLRGYKSSARVPALELVRRLTKKDPRAIPRSGERVPYIVIAGAPNQPLYDCIRTPHEVLNNSGLRANATYYITKVIIPPLERCLNLIGVHVDQWFKEMPHRQVAINKVPCVKDNGKPKSTISHYFESLSCLACEAASKTEICDNCQQQPEAVTLLVLNERLRRNERIYEQVLSICQSCVGNLESVVCESLDCPVMYRRIRAASDVNASSQIRRLISQFD